MNDIEIVYKTYTYTHINIKPNHAHKYAHALLAEAPFTRGAVLGFPEVRMCRRFLTHDCSLEQSSQRE